MTKREIEARRALRMVAHSYLEYLEKFEKPEDNVCVSTFEQWLAYEMPDEEECKEHTYKIKLNGGAISIPFESYVTEEATTEKEQIIKKLKELQNHGKTEEDHIEADHLLLNYINDEEITEAYNGIIKWYN